MTFRQALAVGRRKVVSVEGGKARAEAVRHLLIFSPAPEGEMFRAAGAAAGQYSLAMLLLAAVGHSLLLAATFMVVLLFFLPAATGMIRPSLGGTAAYVALPDAFTGHCMGERRRTQSQGRQQSHDDRRVHGQKKQRCEVAGNTVHVPVSLRWKAGTWRSANGSCCEQRAAESFDEFSWHETKVKAKQRGKSSGKPLPWGRKQG